MAVQHDFVPLPDTPDQCARTGCGSFWNNYVVHRVFTHGGIPARPSITDVVPPTPELDKMSAAKTQSQPAGEFLEWLLGEKGFVLAKYEGDANYPHPIYETIEELLAEHFEIDLKKIEEEKRAMLEYLRSRPA